MSFSCNGLRRLCVGYFATGPYSRLVILFCREVIKADDILPWQMDLALTFPFSFQFQFLLSAPGSYAFHGTGMYSKVTRQLIQRPFGDVAGMITLAYFVLRDTRL